MKYLFLSLLIISCTSGATNNEKLARLMFDSFNKHEWQQMAFFYSEDAEFLDPSFGTTYVKKSRGETERKYSEMQAMFPDIKDDIKSVYAAQDQVIVEFVSSGSSGDSLKFELPICTVLTFKEGKIVRDATYYDK